MLRARTAARTAAREWREVAIPPAVVRPRPAVVGALTRVELRKLVTSAAFLAGLVLVFAFAFLVTGGAIFRSGSEEPPGHRGVVLLFGTGFGLIAATLLGANASALRVHRDRVKELFGSLPSPPEATTAAILLAVVAGPVFLAVAVAVVAFPVFRLDPDIRPYINTALVAQYPLTVLALGAFGVALARWIRSRVAAPVALVAHVMTPL